MALKILPDNDDRSEKMPGSNRLNLFQEISNYLKFMSFIKSCSPLTRRAYQLDLAQAFSLKKAHWSTAWSPTRPELATLEGDALPGPGPHLTEDELLQKVRAAQSAWGHLSLASRNRKAATLQSFLGWMYQESRTRRDLSEQIHAPRVPRRLPRHLSVDEVTSILKTFEKNPAPHELALFLLLYGGGLRVSEACSLRWKDFEKDGTQIRVSGKGGQQRLVPLPEICRESVGKLRTNGTDYVFGENALSTRQAFAWIRRRGEDAGLLNPLHPHALRHSYATHLLSGGASLRHLQELLGHRSLAATEKYTHLGLDHLARVMEKAHPRMGSNRGNRRSRS